MRLIGLVLSLVILLLAGLLIAPTFIDWDKYKPEILAQVKSATGYDVTVEGKIGMFVLPSPALSLSGVKVSAPRKIKAEYLADIKEAKVSVALLPLMKKKIVIETVRLENPVIMMEVMKDGTPGWVTDRLKTVSDAVPPPVKDGVKEGAQKLGDSISLNRIEITDGRFEYLDYTKNTQYAAEKINIDVSADTLNGPFDADGDLTYRGEKITIDLKTKQIDPNSSDLALTARVGAPGVGTAMSYDGVVAIRGGQSAQGQIDVQSKNLSDALVKLMGGTPNTILSGAVGVTGLMTLTPDALTLTDSTINLLDAKGSGRIEISNLVTKNPVQAVIDLDIKGVLDMDALTSKAAPRKTAMRVIAPAMAAGAPSSDIIPASLTLPVNLDATLRLTAEGIKISGQTVKGVVLETVKAGGRINTAFKLLDVPGGGKMDGKLNLAYAAASTSEKTGAVTYSNPSSSFSINGTADQFPVFLKSIGQGGDITRLSNAAQFSATGDVSGKSVNIKNASLKLDDLSTTGQGSYKPASAGGKPDVTLSVNAARVDFDTIKSRLSGQKAAPAQTGFGAPADASAHRAGTSKSGADVAKAVQPIREFSLPVNLTFDMAVAQLRVNGMDLQNVRLAGVSRGSSLTLTSASADNVMGASVILKGQVANLPDLSGIDLDFYGKTPDAESLMKALKVDASKLPAKIGSAEAKVNLKGAPEALSFIANISALSGQVSAQGVMHDALGKPALGDMTFGVKHPNFVQAMKIVSPAFSGSPALARPFDFYAKTNRIDNGYDLTDVKGNFGSTSFSGRLKAITGGSRPDVSGALQFGAIPLDTYLGAKGGSSAAATASSGKDTAAGASTQASSAGGWSTAPLDMGWIRSADMNIDLSAQSITYGGWSFQNPKTDLIMKDGTLTVDKLSAGLFGGQAALDAKVKAGAKPGDAVSLSVTSSMKDVALEPLTYAMSGSRRVQGKGTVSLDMDVAGTGGSANALVGALDGKATLRGQDVVFEGFDFAALSQAVMDSAKPLDRIQQIVSASTTSGQTQFDTVAGDYNIDNGIVAIQSMKMDGASAQIVSQGTVDLPRKYIDTVHTVTLPQAKKMQPFKVNIKGPLSNPTNTFGKGVFDTILREKVQDKVIEKLPDLLGDKTTEKLKKFGILPTQQAPQQPTDSGVSGATEGGAQWNDPAQQNNTAPAEEPAQQPAPEPKDPLQQILENPDKPEEAIKGVLDGLLR
jgi:uncharacterized protein involved in outer membrane biogenesis